MKTQRGMNQGQVDHAVTELKEVSDTQILSEIRQLERNLRTLKSKGTAMVSLPEYRKIRRVYLLLKEVMRCRFGLSLSQEAQNASDRTLPRRSKGHGSSPRRKRGRLSVVHRRPGE